MDSLTHIVVGAVIGELVAGKKIGKKAMALGALAQSIPDVDIVASLWLSPADNLIAHRGLTHSFFFSAFLILFLALIAWRVFKHQLTILQWSVFFGVNVLFHLFIDAFNAYGVGWFEPFEHHRISFHTLYVADPLFSIWCALVIPVLIILRKDHPARNMWARTALSLSMLYVVYALYNKAVVDRDVMHSFKNQKIKQSNHFTTPTPFNTMLWFVVAEADSGYFVGYRSAYDSGAYIPYTYFKRNTSLLNQAPNQHEVNKLIHFAEGYYTVESSNDTLIFNALRFGQIHGWRQPNNPFTFHYYLKPQLDNTMVMQRGRMAGWDGPTIKAYWARMKGIGAIEDPSLKKKNKRRGNKSRQSADSSRQ